MRRVIINSFFLIIPLFLILTFLPVKKRLFYQGLTDDCDNRATWIFDRIHENKKPIDLAFFGSSHTINGIDDKLIERNLNINVANLGYCRFGNNLIYVLIKELIKAKNVKTIIIEVREDEDLYSHPIFPYIAETSDVLTSMPLFNKDLIADYYNHFYYKLEIIRNSIFSQTENNNIRIEDYGLRTSHDTASLDFLIKIQKQRNIKSPDFSSNLREFNMKFPRSCLERIYDLCTKKHINIVFLYLPSYESNIKIPKEYKTYINYGKVLIPPESIFKNVTNWHDENHLNETGSKELSTWLAEKLKKGYL